MDKAVADEVHQQVRVRCRELIRDPGPTRNAIEEALAAALTPQAMQKLVTGFVNTLGLITTGDLERGSDR